MVMSDFNPNNSQIYLLGVAAKETFWKVPSKNPYGISFCEKNHHKMLHKGDFSSNGGRHPSQFVNLHTINRIMIIK
jgi:hypothetical protein